MVWKCACGLDIILALSFLTFSTLRTLSFFDLRFYENVVTVGTLWAQLLIQFYTDLLKLCTCFCHGLEICIWFGYNPWLNFYHFFHFMNFVIFWTQILWKSTDSGYLVSATPHTILYRSLWNFAHDFAMVWSRATEILKSKSVRSTDDVIDVIGTCVRQSQIVTKTNDSSFSSKSVSEIDYFSNTL